MGIHVYYTVNGFFTKAYSYGNEEVLVMSKTGWIILIVCLALVFCIAAGLLLAGRIFNTLLSKGSDTTVDTSATKDYKDLKNDYSADGVYTVQLKDLKELDIDWISGSVTVALTDEDVVRFVETAQKEIKEKDALRYGVSGDTLRIQACKKGYVGKLPEKDLTVLLIGVGIAVVVAVFAAVKSYPEDYDAAGKLLVDGAKMANDTYKGVGWSLGFLSGWVLERRRIHFSTDVPMKTRMTRLVTGLLGHYAVSLILVPLLKSWIPGAAGTIVSCFLQMFYVVFLFPWCIKHFEPCGLSGQTAREA